MSIAPLVEVGHFAVDPMAGMRAIARLELEDNGSPLTDIESQAIFAKDFLVGSKSV